METVEVKYIVEKLKKLNLYELTVGGESEYSLCIEEEVSSRFGEWVKKEDIQSLISELENINK